MVPKREAESNTDSLVDVEIKSESSDELEPMDQFFSQYSWFDYNAPLPASQQFKRLREEAGWNRGDAEGTQAWEGYRTALVRQFNSTYSSDLDDLEAWHALIRHIGVVELPNTAEECQTVRNHFYFQRYLHQPISSSSLLRGNTSTSSTSLTPAMIPPL